MEWIAKKAPRILIWFGFGIVFAVLPILILGAIKLVSDDAAAGSQAMRDAVLDGDMLLIIAAILADAVGRLIQDVVTREPPAFLGFKLSFAFIMTGLAASCGVVYVEAFSRLHAKPAPQPVNTGFVWGMSMILLGVAVVFGFAVILMTGD